jgi:CheY-like chemotaxis protein
VNHLVRLVDDLMEMSRIARGSFELRRESIPLQAVLRNAIETSEPLIAAAGHRLAVALPEELIALDADPVRLAQVFANLLNNAARYTPPGGDIRVEARRERDETVVEVSDTGEGIEPAELPRLFEMFSQGNRTSRRSQGGLGIGLALARRLVQMHGGSVSARSEGRGKGSCFTVRLPLSKAACGAPPVSLRETSTVAPHRVLVVDDNRDAADSLGMLLKFLGADVAVAHDGPAALETFEAYRPGIVLLDIGMPGMNGYEVARAIRRKAGGRRVPLIALSGWGQEDDRRRAREAGFDHHLIKPAEIGALQSLLATL